MASLESASDSLILIDEANLQNLMSEMTVLLSQHYFYKKHKFDEILRISP